MVFFFLKSTILLKIVFPVSQFVETLQEMIKRLENSPLFVLFWIFLLILFLNWNTYTWFLLTSRQVERELLVTYKKRTEFLERLLEAEKMVSITVALFRQWILSSCYVTDVLSGKFDTKIRCCSNVGSTTVLEFFCYEGNLPKKYGKLRERFEERIVSGFVGFLFLYSSWWFLHILLNYLLLQ